MPLSSYAATRAPVVRMITSLKMSRTGSNSENAGWWRDALCCSIVVGIDLLLFEVVELHSRIRLKPAIDSGLGVPRQKIFQIAAGFSVLEQHEEWDAQHWNDILQKHVHRYPEHVTIDPPAEDVGEGRQTHHDEPVFELEVQEAHARVQIAVNRADI